MHQSIRHSLLGMLADFVRQAGFQHSVCHDLVCELVFLLSSYREEEVPLFPEVYLIDATASSDVLSAIAPGAERIPLGSAPLDRSAAVTVLKNAAFLATEGWAVYVMQQREMFEYGIFRAYSLPFSVSASESLQSEIPAPGPVVMMRNCAAHCVELCDGLGHPYEISMTSAPPSERPVSAVVADLSAVITADVDADLRRDASGYMRRLLYDALQHSHGTLMAIVPASQRKLPKGLTDGTVFEDAIDLLDPLKALRDRPTVEALASLRSKESLLHGMVSSDGITVLSTDARVRAFRVFIKPNAREARRLDALAHSGGARSRAFEILKMRLGNSLRATFLRSQDGRTEFHEFGK